MSPGTGLAIAGLIPLGVAVYMIIVLIVHRILKKPIRMNPDYRPHRDEWYPF
jgi:hypothetical protein